MRRCAGASASASRGRSSATATGSIRRSSSSCKCGAPNAPRNATSIGCWRRRRKRLLRCSGARLPQSSICEGRPFVGYIDRLDRDERSGGIGVVDYKTGSIATSAAEYRREGPPLSRLSASLLLLGTHGCRRSGYAAGPDPSQRRAARRASDRSPRRQEHRHRRARAVAHAHDRAERRARVGRRFAAFKPTEESGRLHVLRICNGVPFQTAGRSAALRKLIVLELNAEQRTAVEAPYDECFAIWAPPGPARARRWPTHRPSPRSSTRCRSAGRRIGTQLSTSMPSRCFARAGHEVTLVDDVEAELTLRGGLRTALRAAMGRVCPAPTRSRSSRTAFPRAFSPIGVSFDSPLARCRRRARASLSRALTGATEFYANPPNLADPAPALCDEELYHDSLDATPEELLRQHRREIDLAKILTRLYQRYLELVASSGRMTGTRCGDRRRPLRSKRCRARAQCCATGIDSLSSMTPKS